MGKIIYKQSLFWKLYAYVYDLMLINPPYQELLKEAISLIENKTYKKILDGGCGTGNLESLIDVSNSNIRIVGIDSSVEMIKRAINKHKDNNKFSFIVANLDVRLPFTSESFDVVIALNSLYTVNDLLYTIQELNRVLKKGGKI